MRVRRRRPWSLRTRLVVSAVGLIAVVAAVIGTVTTIAFRSYLYDQADEQLHSVSARASGPPAAMVPGPGLPDPVRVKDPLLFVQGPGAPIGTLGAVLVDGELTSAGYSAEFEEETGTDAQPGTGTGTGTDAQPGTQAGTGTRTGDGGPYGRNVRTTALDAAQRAVLAAVPRDGEPHTVELPGGLGSYRVEYASGVHGAFLTGIPLSGVEKALSTLVLVELSVTGAGLVAASLAGTVLVGVALRPLRRVVATAGQVAQLPLHSGEVALHQRVPETEADPRTEVGQVGAALNRMLDHVHSALDARQQSETRVRQFVADASHELRTPLASIRGYAELTRRGREECGPDTRHALGRIESEATRMTGLVEDLLLLARLDAGRPLSYEATDLVPLVVDAVSDARAAGAGHHWRLELPEGGGSSVRADGARIQQVLVNLLANARTHTPPGTKVTARVRAEDTAAVVEIEDDGPGIPPALLPSVFERFARGDASRSRNAGSTGLGLAIVRAVVLAHGGEVTVTSAPGRTVFTVRLPADEPARTHSQAGHRLITQP
ncbi:HAMP domain-containing sensor histidine kinase [Streptomyces lateritius]|uniref:sensor histidine kinase n=1 Tax=Streptomyces lateritius TaxID=67313 RepID=UPI001C8C5807|nr:HAMP domain-containing sensor histidine kinase [Streptomyces lateritius]MBX9424014.1 HAMP domain-containing histidine kinase [Streptomyces lateritius]